jgi:hypothetical protein
MMILNMTLSEPPAAMILDLLSPQSDKSKITTKVAPVARGAISPRSRLIGIEASGAHH